MELALGIVFVAVACFFIGYAVSWLTERHEGGYEDIARIDRMLEPEVNAEIARMDKNWACHQSIFDCHHPAPTEEKPQSREQSRGGTCAYGCCESPQDRCKRGE